MAKIMFNERYGLQSSVFEKIKIHTRREPFYSDESVCCEFNQQGKLECFTYDGESKYLVHTSRYAKGEIVAVAQSYHDIFLEVDDVSAFERSMFGFYPEVEIYEDLIGWKNKMFVKAELMPHHIKITNIRCERLQDISDSDCIKEGIIYSASKYSYEFLDKKKNIVYLNFSPKCVFCTLIGKLNGKKFWDTNPYVIVYEFELVD